jgi:hypothetical protein
VLPKYRKQPHAKVPAAGMDASKAGWHVGQITGISSPSRNPVNARRSATMQRAVAIAAQHPRPPLQLEPTAAIACA